MSQDVPQSPENPESGSSEQGTGEPAAEPAATPPVPPQPERMGLRLLAIGIAVVLAIGVIIVVIQTTSHPAAGDSAPYADPTTPPVPGSPVTCRTSGSQYECIPGYTSVFGQLPAGMQSKGYFCSLETPDMADLGNLECETPASETTNTTMEVDFQAPDGKTGNPELSGFNIIVLLDEGASPEDPQTDLGPQACRMLPQVFTPVVDVVFAKFPRLLADMATWLRQNSGSCPSYTDNTKSSPQSEGDVDGYSMTLLPPKSDTQTPANGAGPVTSYYAGIDVDAGP